MITPAYHRRCLIVKASLKSSDKNRCFSFAMLLYSYYSILVNIIYILYCDVVDSFSSYLTAWIPSLSSPCFAWVKSKLASAYPSFRYLLGINLNKVRFDKGFDPFSFRYLRGIYAVLSGIFRYFPVFTLSACICTVPVPVDAQWLLLLLFGSMYWPGQKGQKLSGILKKPDIARENAWYWTNE